MQQPTVPFCLHVELRDVNDLRSGHLSVITAVKSITLCIKFKMQGSPQFTASKLQLFSIAQASNPNHSSSPPNLVTKRKGEHSGLHLHATTSHDLTAHFFHKYCQCLQCGNYYVWIHWSKSWWGVLQAYHQNCLSLKSCKYMLQLHKNQQLARQKGRAMVKRITSLALYHHLNIFANASPFKSVAFSFSFLFVFMFVQFLLCSLIQWNKSIHIIVMT